MVRVAVGVANRGVRFVVADGSGGVGDGGIAVAIGAAMGVGVVVGAAMDVGVVVGAAMGAAVAVAVGALAVAVAVGATAVGVAVGALAMVVGVTVATVVGAAMLVVGTGLARVLAAVGIAAVRAGSDDGIGGGDGTGAADGRCVAPAMDVADDGTGDAVTKTIVTVAPDCRVSAVGVAGGTTTIAVDGSRVGTAVVAVVAVVLVAVGVRTVVVGDCSMLVALWMPVLSAETRRIAAAMANAAPMAVVARGCATMARRGRGRLPGASPPLPAAGAPRCGRSTRRPDLWSASDTNSGTATGTPWRA